MISQALHIVQDCPACSCPVEIPADGRQDKTVCGHCSERFSAFGMGNQIAAVYEQPQTAALLWHTDSAGRTWVYPPCVHPELRPVKSVVQNSSAIAYGASPVLIVEHRDEVFARIAADLAANGSRVVRAETANEAIRICEIYQPQLVIANLDLPDQSGWLMAAKLQYFAADLRIWLYQSETSDYDEGMAQFLKLDELLVYGGNLLRLSEIIVSLISRRPKPPNAALEPVALVAV